MELRMSRMRSPLMLMPCFNRLDVLRIAVTTSTVLAGCQVAFSRPARPPRGSDLGRFAVVLSKSDGIPPVDPGDDGFRSLERSVRSWVRRRVLRRHLPASCAEDVIQEVLLRCLELRHRLRDADEGQRTAWLRAIARNVAVDAARRQRRSRAADADWPG